MRAVKWFSAVTIDGKSYAVRFWEAWVQGTKQFTWVAKRGPHKVAASGVVKGPRDAWKAAAKHWRWYRQLRRYQQ
jgi:hypothetical protein